MLKKIIFTLLMFCPLLGEYPVVILGGGIAALTAALQVTQTGVQPVVIPGLMPGGIITKSTHVQNWPGEIEVTGTELADKLQQQAEERGVLFYPGVVTDIDVSKKPFVITVNNPFEKKSEQIEATTCIIALGAVPNKLKVPGEAENLFKTIFTCASCDGLRFKDKTVAVIGGSDGALEEARYLSGIAKKVVIIVRSDKFITILGALRDEILARSNIEVIYNTTVESIQNKGEGVVLKLKNQTVAVDGVFLAIGSLPNTHLFKGKLELDDEGYIVLKDVQETSIPGIFAAGDVTDKVFQQAITAAGDGCKAALQAQKLFPQHAPIQEISNPSDVKYLNSVAELQEVLTSSHKPVVVYFSQTWCGPCRAFKHTYGKWASQYRDKAAFYKVDENSCPDCFAVYGVNSFPTVLVFDSKGKLIHQATGNDLSTIPSVIEKVK